MLKRTRLSFPLEITLRAGVRALLVELGTVTPHTVQWRRAVDMVNDSGGYKHYCYLGTSVALQKSLLQARTSKPPPPRVCPVTRPVT